MSKTVYLLSLGCAKNLVDSEVILGHLDRAGYRIVHQPEEADLLVANTCGFIRPAVEEAVEEILSLAEIKKKAPQTRLVVTGCLVQRYGEELARELPEVDLFIGTDGFQDIVASLEGLGPEGPRLIRLAAPSFIMEDATPRLLSTPPHRAYLKITEGCTNRCSYCMIPSIRGSLRSRPADDLVREAQRLAAGGVKELTLIAQDLTAYGLDLTPGRPQLPALLERLLASCSIPWLRLLYLYPTKVDSALLELIAAEPRLLPYLDIPLQHVSDRVLKRMNRPYGQAAIEALLGRIRERLPAATLRTTFMVGFPGESEADVALIEEFLKRHRFDHVGIFSYSREEGSAAADLDGQLSEEIKEARRERLMAVQMPIAHAKNEERVGTVAEVLVEGVSRESDLLLEGRGRFQASDVDGCVYITAGTCDAGEIVKVAITEAHPYDLIGEIVEE